MPGPFAITAASNAIVLDTRRQGQASFVVTNVSGRPIRGRARLVSQDPSAVSWLSILGDGERDFAVAGTQQYAVQVAVPSGAPTGSYLFRLDMVGVENPDEDFTEGPTVTFRVQPSEPLPPRPKSKGYVAALVGSIIGGLVGGIVLGCVGVAVASRIVRPSEFNEAAMVLASIGFVPGYWIASTIGCLLALSYRHQFEQATTALIHALFLPIWTVVVAVLLALLLAKPLGWYTVVPIFLLVTTVPPLVARGAIVRLRTGRF